MTYIEKVKATLDSLNENDMEEIVQVLLWARGRGSSVYVLGNGGSDSLSQHLVLHLRDASIRAFDLMADLAWLTAQANDYGYQNAPTALLDLLWRPKDVLVAISGSARSENIKAAMRAIHGVGDGFIVGLLGSGGDKIKEFCHASIVLPQTEYGPLEDVFSCIVHMIAERLRC